VAVLLLALGWAVLDAWHAARAARASLAEARTDLGSLTALRSELLTVDGRRQAAATLDQVGDLAAQAAQQLRSSRGLDVLGVLPYLGAQRTASLDLALDVEQTAATGHLLLATVDTLVADSRGGVVSLPALAQLDRQLVTAVGRQRRMDRPDGGLLHPLADARAKFDTLDLRIVSLLDQGQRLVSYAIPFLGGDGPRTYLVAAENNAEMRDGGAVLSYSVLTTDAGSYTATTAQTVGDIVLSHPAAVPVPAGTQAVFGGYAPTQLWQSTDATADFAWSGADMQAMFAQATGVRVDGVIGVDVPMLGRLLALTGPVLVPGISVPVSAANVVPLLLHDLYDGERPSSEVVHEDREAAVFRAIIRQLRHSHVDVARLADALAQGVAGRHLMVWDGVPAYERTLAAFGASGTVAGTEPSRTFHLAVENGTASKLDYYVHVSLVARVVVTAGNHAVVNTTVTVVNDAPAGQAPSYQLGPDGISSTVVGQYIGHVYLWSPLGAQVEGGVPESGLIVAEHDVSVLPQQHATVRFQTVIPAAVRDGRLDLDYVPQPRIFPEQLTVLLSAPSWLLGSEPLAVAAIARELHLSFALTRS
jgi:hypothetical protein